MRKTKLFNHLVLESFGFFSSIRSLLSKQKLQSDLLKIRLKTTNYDTN